MELRLLTEHDAQASTTMSHHAFGAPLGGRAAFTVGAGISRWGIFDGTTLAAKAVDRAYESMIGGRRVPTAGVAGVAVAPEYRGTGLARRLMTHLMAEARNRGAVVSSLFRTAPGLYRSLGYEEVAELIDGTYPTSSLRAVRPETATLRRATKADGTAIRSVYAAVAAAGSCLLTRDGPAFGASDEELIGSFDGITLAEEPDGTVVGYASWDRGHGYGDGAALSVADLLATSVDGYRALLAAIASFESVTPTVAIRTSGTDPVHWLVPASGWQVASVRQYMLRILDLPAAIAARGWPATAVADVVLDVEDTTCPWNNGRHRLVVQNGAGSIDGMGPTTREGHTAGEVTTISARGLAVLYAGGVPVATLRRAGLLWRGSAASDSALDAVFAGPRPAILDYF